MSQPGGDTAPETAAAVGYDAVDPPLFMDTVHGKIRERQVTAPIGAG
ncbi:hypothetical protein [Streptomyces sp. NPDC056921]